LKPGWATQQYCVKKKKKESQNSNCLGDGGKRIAVRDWSQAESMRPYLKNKLRAL
jgi:hypothetical protein